MKFKPPFLEEEKQKYFLALPNTTFQKRGFDKRKGEEVVLSLDIGTEVIKALIFSTFARPAGYGGSAETRGHGEKKESEKIIVLGTSTQYFEQFGVSDTKDFEEEILKKAISKALQNPTLSLEKAGLEGQALKDLPVIIGLPANILRGRVVPQNLKRKNQKKIISEIEENQIYKEVSDLVKEKLSQEFAQEVGILPEDFYFSNLKILEIKIDGYKISSIRGLNGRNLDFKILAIFLSKYYLERIKKICRDLNLKILKIVHQAENLPFLFQEKKINAIFLDIGGGLTTIFLVEKGKLKGISEFKKGGVDFTRKLSQILGLSVQEARVLKHNYSQSFLSEQVKKRVKEIFSDDIQNWFKNLKEALNKFSKKLFPSNIFLFGGGSLLPEIAEILEKGDWTDSPLVLKPKVKFIYPKDLENIEDKTKGLNSPQEIPLLLVSYFS